MKTYTGSCVTSTNLALLPMLKKAIQIDFKAFAQAVDMEQVRRLFPQYNWTNNRSNGLRLKDDALVSYWRSTFLNRPCVFMEHSCIEYIFS